MLTRLTAIGLVAWALVGPAVCEAACAAPAAIPSCHAPASGAAPAAPDEHSDQECCDDAVFAAAVAEFQLGAGHAHMAPEIEIVLEGEALSTALLRPPDLANTPFLRVSPPLIVYAV